MAIVKSFDVTLVKHDPSKGWVSLVADDRAAYKAQFLRDGDRLVLVFKQKAPENKVRDTYLACWN